MYKKEKYSVGRPKLAATKVLKAAKVEIVLAFILCATFALSGGSALTGKSPIELLSFGQSDKASGNLVIGSDSASTSAYTFTLDTNNGDMRIFVPNADEYLTYQLYYKETNSSTTWKLAEKENIEPYVFDYFHHVNNRKYFFRKLANFGPITANKYRVFIRSLYSTGSVNKTNTRKYCKTGWTYNSNTYYCYKDITINKKAILSKIRVSSNYYYEDLEISISPTYNGKYITARKYKYNTSTKKWVIQPQTFYLNSSNTNRSYESLSVSVINSGSNNNYYKEVGNGYNIDTTVRGKYRINVRLESSPGVTDKTATMNACPTGWLKYSDRSWCYKYYEITN
ncbi:MAG TPA: hypothetical protein PKY25_00005 [Bacilli bacterium]|nr:hypothetical protein [Bacilli bacterium]